MGKIREVLVPALDDLIFQTSDQPCWIKNLNAYLCEGSLAKKNDFLFQIYVPKIIRTWSKLSDGTFKVDFYWVRVLSKWFYYETTSCEINSDECTFINFSKM